jgi:type I restriction enzyme S subunit
MKRYPAYKDSGIEWIGEIPEHWELHKVVSHIALINGYPFNSEYFNQYEGTPLVRIRDITSGKTENYYLGEFPEESIIDNGDILIGMDGAFLVRWWEGGRALLNQRCCCLRTKETINKRYLFYLLQYPLDIINDLTYFTTVKHISSAQIVRIKYPYPSTTEQQSIANYLDRKTHLIDTLIENKQKLIDLLKEQRTAIINQAVTKGLNPNVKLKDSGIEWLGEIPEQWGIARLKFISNIKYGLGQPPRALEGGLPIIRATNIKEGKISPDDLLYVDPKDVPYDRDPILKENDIIVVRSGAYTGDSAIIPREYEGAVAGYDMVACVHKANPEYIAYSLLSHSILHNQIDLCRFRAAQPHLNAEELGDTLVFLPPEDEQKMIVEFIKHESEMIVSINQNLEELIKFLKEYRTALISEVVTGKIDVRDSGIPEVMPS